MQAYFLSDLHLGAPYFKDRIEAERRVVSFLDSIKRKADVLYLLGDILDYWYEYRYVVPRGFVRFFGKLAELSDSGIRIVWLIGNHDIWIYDYIPTELGIEVVDGALTEVIDGRKFYMTHGDGVGELKPAFRLMRSLFRNKFCQKLFSAIHPRWTVPFAYNWSSHSRKTGGSSGYESTGAMVENLRQHSLDYLKTHPDINYFIYGHLHIMLQESLVLPPEESQASHADMIVLGDWITHFSYGHWDGTRFELSSIPV